MTINSLNNTWFFKKIFKNITETKTKIKKKVEEILSLEEINDKNLFIEFVTNDSISEEWRLIIKDRFIWKIVFEDIKYILKNKKISEISKYILIRELDKTAGNIEKLIELWFDPKKFLFEVDSDWWEIFDEIIKRTLENKSDIYTEMRKIVKIFLEKENIKNKSSKSEEKEFLINFFKKQNFKNQYENNNLWLNNKKIDLSVYLRYWHKVDQPEITELIIILLDEIQKNNWFIFFDWIRIIPRFKYKFKPKFLLKNIDWRFFDVEKKDFEKSMLFNSCPIFLSHSSWPFLWEIPSIISSWMIESESEINLWIETENTDEYKSKIQNQENINKKLNSEQVLEKTYNSIKKLENRLKIIVTEEKIKESVNF